MKQRITYFTAMLFTAVLFFSCSDMLAELNGKKKSGSTNGEPLSIELTAGKPQKNGEGGQKLTVTVAVSTDSEVKKVVWKKDGTEIAKRLLEDENASEAGATNDNKKWTFEITAANETDGNGTYTVAVLDGAGRRETEQITIDFTKPPKPDGTGITVDYPSAADDTSIKLTWSEPDESAEPNYDHAEITLTYTQDDGNGATKTSAPVTISVNKGTKEYTFSEKDLTDDKKKDYNFTIKYVDTVGNESDPCSVTATKYTLSYPTGTDTATKTVLVKDGGKLKADQLPPALPDTNDHYFAGWYDSNDSTKTLIKEGSRLTGDVSLAPKWECAISYDKGEHGTAPTQTRVDEGAKITVSKLPVPEPTEADKRDFWGFADWYLDSSCSDDKKVTDNYEVTKNTTLYAKWVKGRALTESVKELGINEYIGTAGEATGETADESTYKIIYVEFGDWPQTIKNDEVRVYEDTKKEQGMFTYCLGSDGEWYVNYENRWYKVEPIKWRVLTKEFDHDNEESTEKQWLLLAENILAAGVPYYLNKNERTIGGSTVYPNNYKYSTIRAWLNGKYEDDDTQEKTYENGFLQSAFTSAVQNALQATKVDNSDESTTDAGGNLPKATKYKCDDTSDKIFLLSEKEVTTGAYGFDVYNAYKGDKKHNESARIRVTTDYARATGAYQPSTSGYGGWWWLRSPYCYSSYYARYVDDDGRANTDFDVDDTYGGIVPALSISAQ